MRKAPRPRARPVALDEDDCVVRLSKLNVKGEGGSEGKDEENERLLERESVEAVEPESEVKAYGGLGLTPELPELLNVVL